MADTHRDQRLTDASSLREALSSLLHVQPEKRAEFVHDRLMSAVDDICKKHAVGGNKGFTPTQTWIVKDIAYQIVYILDPLNQPQKVGFLQSLLTEWKEKTAFGKIKIIFSTILILIPFSLGTFELVKKGVPIWEAIFTSAEKTIEKKIEPASEPQPKTTPRAANIPSTGVTPGAQVPPR